MTRSSCSPARSRPDRRPLSITRTSGTRCASVNRLDDAGARYERAIQLNPSYALAHINLGAIRRQQGRARDAVEHFRHALRLEPKQLGGWMNLGNALRDLNELDEALDAYQRASSLDPNLADAHGAAATTLAALNRISEAKLNFQAALQTLAEPSADAGELRHDAAKPERLRRRDRVVPQGTGPRSRQW